MRGADFGNRLWVNARAFLEAARALEASESSVFRPAIYSNLHLAIELSLKGLLFHRGWTPAQLRRLSHDLPAAKAKAEEAGFEIDDVLMVELIAQLGADIGAIRYLEQDRYELVLADEAIAAVDALHTKVGKAILEHLTR